jgi:hypothetical protein
MPKEIRRALEQAKDQGQLSPEIYGLLTKNFDAIRFGVMAFVILMVFSSVLGSIIPEYTFLVFIVGAVIAYSMWKKRKSGYPAEPPPVSDIERRPREGKTFGPDAQIQHRPWITGHPIGLVLTLGVGAALWFVAPLSRAFLLGALVGGVMIAIVQAIFRYWSR